MTTMPEDITPRLYDSDIVLTGPNLTAAAFNDIKLTMKPEDRKQVIGWLRAVAEYLNGATVPAQALLDAYTSLSRRVRAVRKGTQ